MNFPITHAEVNKGEVYIGMLAPRSMVTYTKSLRLGKVNYAGWRPMFISLKEAKAELSKLGPVTKKKLIEFQDRLLVENIKSLWT